MTEEEKLDAGLYYVYYKVTERVGEAFKDGIQ